MFDREARISPGLVRSMADAIHHRGPDDDGYYIQGQVGLGFRRLSIIDLNTGHQPISSENGSVWVVFNGEIYNYKELRSELVAKGHIFRTQTDTEVLVHLYEEHGPDLVSKLRGMFGFAIWDSAAQLLMLARDRVGIKPLYYCLADRFISFGSEIKAILADPNVSAEVDARVIDRFLTFLYLPGEDTLFKNIFKLAPGSYLLAQAGKITIRRYWDFSFQPKQPALSLQAAQEQFTAVLDEAVQLHMISDVPVGFLLSGGIDSTAMLSFAAERTEQPLSSYTVGFSAAGIVDERPYARLAADTFGTDHHELTISSADFSNFMPGYVRHMEEPVCEPPAIALYYISQLARNHVKVLISGEGGDEAFAGYSNYRNLVWFERLKNLLGPGKPLARGAMRVLGKLTGSTRIGKYEPLMNGALDSYYFSRTATPYNYFNSSALQLYSADLSEVSRKEWSLDPVTKYFGAAAGYGNLSKMLYVDSKSWLPDDLLVKADKMTMANSIELRVPLLDHKVLEFAASLPESFKLRRFTTKYLARKALGARVPAKILERRKAGFPVPYQTWIRKDLKHWFRSLLLDSRSLQRGYFSRKALEKLLEDNQDGEDYSKEIFSLGVLELWHRVFLDKVPSAPPREPSSSPVALNN